VLQALHIAVLRAETQSLLPMCHKSLFIELLKIIIISDTILIKQEAWIKYLGLNKEKEKKL
jgi:hypothetical protein